MVCGMIEIVSAENNKEFFLVLDNIIGVSKKQT